MKLVYFSNSVIPSERANSIHVMRMCEAFAENGMEVILICQKGKTLQDNFSYYGIKQNFKIIDIQTLQLKGSLFLYAFKALKIIKKIKPAIVYSRFLEGSFFLKKSIQALHFFEFHDAVWSKGKLPYLLFDGIVKRKNINGFVVISRRLKEDFIQAFPDSIKPVYVMHDGATVYHTSNNGSNKRKDKITVGYVGSLKKGKGVELIGEMATLDSNITFHIYGGSENEIKELKSQYKAKNIIWHGFRSPAEMPAIINEIDICLLPNQKYIQTGINKNNIADYTSPLKLFEYMSHGKAIVASDLPVLKEVLNDDNSVLVTCDDVICWVDAIKELINADIKRTAIGNKAKQDFINYYTWNARAKNILNII